MEDINYCTRCGESLKPGTEILLELSQDEGLYYKNLPKEKISQGLFNFGKQCAKKQLEEQNE